MVRTTWLTVLALALVTPLFMPTFALSQACAIGTPPILANQDDAGSGGDAADHAVTRLVLGGQGDYVGALQLPVSEGPGDGADWYALVVDGPRDVVMASLRSYVENDELKDMLAELFVMDVVPPGATEPLITLPMGAPQAMLPAVEGQWLFGVRFQESATDPCAGSALALHDQWLLTNYTFYVGCNPIC